MRRASTLCAHSRGKTNPAEKSGAQIKKAEFKIPPFAFFLKPHALLRLTAVAEYAGDGVKEAVPELL